MSTSAPTPDFQQSADNMTREVIPWVVWLAKLGYAAKGIVYVTIGLLGVQLAIGSGGKTAGPSEALQSLYNQRFGWAMLAMVAIGLFAYMIWRLVQAWKDPDNAGSDLSGIVKRIGFAVSGIAYGIFGVAAVQILMRQIGGDGEVTVDRLVSWLMSRPFGQWLVGLIGVILIGTGLYQFYRAYEASFRDKLRLSAMSESEDKWVTIAGRIGFAARGVVYSILGYFLVVAALEFDPDEAVGIGGALGKLLEQPYGRWLLGAAAVGLLIYGFYALILARYRRIFFG